MPTKQKPLRLSPDVVLPDGRKFWIDFEWKEANGEPEGPLVERVSSTRVGADEWLALDDETKRAILTQLWIDHGN